MEYQDHSFDQVKPLGEEGVEYDREAKHGDDEQGPVPSFVDVPAVVEDE